MLDGTICSVPRRFRYPAANGWWVSVGSYARPHRAPSGVTAYRLYGRAVYHHTHLSRFGPSAAALRRGLSVCSGFRLWSASLVCCPTSSLTLSGPHGSAQPRPPSR